MHRRIYTYSFLNQRVTTSPSNEHNSNNTLQNGHAKVEKKREYKDIGTNEKPDDKTKVPDDAHLTPDKSSIIHQNVQYAADSDKDVDIAPSYTRDLTRIGRPSLSVDSIRKRRNHHKEGDIQTKPKQPNP